ncbi:hypothetical protein MMC24_001666 [Lignoscripta atroalba]|nr:hypothetical protein [Lignoscripta atroalba]
MPALANLPLPNWSSTKRTSKQGFDKAWHWVDKLGAPVNRLSNKIGSEAFWPTSLDKESEKAARILRSFCKDGFYDGQESPKHPDGPKGKQRVVKKIPMEVIRNAKGLAIFTTMRTGLWVSGAGGSGVLVGRTPTGQWSPPSGIMLHTAGLGFLVGVDIYDCVIVINTEEALEAFTKIRCTIGGEVSAVTGPVGIGGVMESEVHKRQAPVWTYLKSRGFYAGVQVDGTIIIERTDENARFYGEKIGAADILSGKVRHPPVELKMLMQTLKAAQGDNDVDAAALPGTEPTPGDLEVERMDEMSGFGLPAVDDPDPFGVHALEKEGLEIREAGTKRRPSSDAFDYKPAPTSPIFSTFGRPSMDSVSRRSSRRDSKMSVASIDRGTQTAEIATQTIDEGSRETNNHSPAKKTSENLSRFLDGEEDDQVEGEAKANPSDPSLHIHEVSQAASSPVMARARLVTIPKRIPPALPPRSPYRSRGPIVVNAERPSSKDSSGQMNGSNLSSPDKNDFDEVSLNGSEKPDGSMIAMNDNEGNFNSAPKEHEASNEKVFHESEEFHSVPSTPVEPHAPRASMKEEIKEDFT